jgi:hypothetical protein
MELDELKARWDALDRRLDAQAALGRETLRELRLGKVDGALARQRRRVAAELVLNVLGLWWMAVYTVERIGAVRFFVPGLALSVGLALLLSAGVRQLIWLARVDYGAQVAELQARLAAAQRSLVRTTMWVFLLAPLVWTPLLVVGLDGLLGVDAYAVLGGAYLAANLAFGMAALPLLWWAGRRFAARFADRPWFARLLRDVGGQSLADAQAEVAALGSFVDGGDERIG